MLGAWRPQIISAASSRNRFECMVEICDDIVDVLNPNRDLENMSYKPETEVVVAYPYEIWGDPGL